MIRSEVLKQLIPVISDQLVVCNIVLAFSVSLVAHHMQQR